jgi:hypothetical protein
MKYTEQELIDFTLDGLRDICRNLGIKGMSKQRKDVVIDNILSIQESESMPEQIKGQFRTTVIDSDAPAGERTETRIKVSCGASSDKFSVCGKTVGAVAELLKEALNIDRMSLGIVNGEEVDNSYIIESGDSLEFLKPAGDKGDEEAPSSPATPVSVKPTMKEIHNRPEVRQKHKAAMKAAWANPDIASKIKSAMRAAQEKKRLLKKTSV